ncbi:MAG: hypothetical protein M0R75_06595 [Dehalococcoidia bacterium]|nr:hypothetical protein [Dehalococcoidia bacterium]
MPQDGGWIQLVEPRTRRISARAHLMVNEATPSGWRGHLRSVRPHPGVTPLAGDYIALFGPWTEPHLVHIADDLATDAPRITSDDGEPSVLRERPESG